MFGFCLEGSISWGRRMPIFRGYPRHCTINGSWITSPSATAAVSRRLPHSKMPLVIGTVMPASGRRSKYPDETSDFVTRRLLDPSGNDVIADVRPKPNLSDSGLLGAKWALTGTKISY